MSAPKARLLIVDDEPQILRFLRTALRADGFEVVEASTGAEAVRLATLHAPDLVVLDLGLPDMDGREVIRVLREGLDTPILVLSARTRERDKIEALDLGADDYVDKPFGVGELMARIRAALRQRVRRETGRSEYRLGDLSVDLAARLVRKGGQVVHLTPREYELLTALVKQAGKVVTHGHLLRAVWGPAHAEETAILRVYVAQLRRKIEDDPEHPVVVLTEPGVGYRLRDDE